MLRKTMIIFATAAALTAGLTADAFARGGGGHGGGFGGGAHIGSLNASHLGGTRAAFARGGVGQHFAAARGHFAHEAHFRHGRRFVPGFYDYDYGCSYGYPYYNSYSCYYPPSYY